MSSSKFNTSSPLITNAGNASPLRAKLQAALDAYDKENASGPSGTPPKSRPSRGFNRHSLPESMNSNTDEYPLDTNQGLAAGSKAPHSMRGRLSDGGATLNQGGDGLADTFQLKTTEKRLASMAEMASVNVEGVPGLTTEQDEPSSPSKRPRRDDGKNSFIFIENLKLLHEDNILARQMFLDLVDAQDKRAAYGGHNPKEIFTMVPCIDPKDLFDQGDTPFSSALDKAAADCTSIMQESEGDSIFGSWFQQLLAQEDAKDQRKGEAGSSQKGGDHNITSNCDIPPEENRVDVTEAPAGCETSGGDESPTEPLPLIEAATDSSPLNANLDPIAPYSSRGSNSSPQLASIPPHVAHAPPKVVPEASHLPTAEKTKPDGEKKGGRELKAMQARSHEFVNIGVAGPSTSRSTGPFVYSDARAQEIWQLAKLGDHLGAHALFDPSEQVTLIKSGKNVQKHLKKDPKLQKRLQDSPEGTDRECLYVCGASAIWKRSGNSKELTAGETLEYQLTYKRCKDRAYATIDHYKKHVYRYHLHKHYKMYKKEAGEDEEEKEEPAKGKGKAPEKRRKAEAVKKEDDGYEDEVHEEQN